MTPLREKRKKEILNSALTVFSKEGYHKGTVEEIAQLSNIGKATVYEYFSSKKNIFEEMILEVLNSYVETSKEHIATKNTVREKLVSLLNFNIDFINKTAEIIERVFFGFDGVSDDFHPTIIKFHDKLHQFFVSLIEEGMENNEINKSLDEELMSLMLINTIYGMSSSKRVFTLEKDIDANTVIDIIFHGIG